MACCSPASGVKTQGRPGIRFADGWLVADANNHVRKRERLTFPLSIASRLDSATSKSTHGMSNIQMHTLNDRMPRSYWQAASDSCIEDISLTLKKKSTHLTPVTIQHGISRIQDTSLANVRNRKTGINLRHFFVTTQGLQRWVECSHRQRSCQSSFLRLHLQSKHQPVTMSPLATKRLPRW